MSHAGGALAKLDGSSVDRNKGMGMYWLIMLAIAVGPRGSAPSTAVLHVGTFTTIDRCGDAKKEALAKNQDTTGVAQVRWFCVRSDDQAAAH